MIIDIWIIENTVTKKQPAASVADFKILFVSLSFLSEINKFAPTVMEKPLNKELISIVRFAKAPQYSNVISIAFR